MKFLIRGPTGKEVMLQTDSSATVGSIEVKIQNIFEVQNTVQIFTNTSILRKECLIKYAIDRKENIMFRFLEDNLQRKRPSQETKLDIFISKINSFTKTFNETSPRIEAVYKQNFSISKISKMNFSKEQHNSINMLKELGYSEGNSIAALEEFKYNRFYAANLLSNNNGIYPFKHELIINTPVFNDSTNNEGKLNFKEEEMVAKFKSISLNFNNPSPYVNLNPISNRSKASNLPTFLISSSTKQNRGIFEIETKNQAENNKNYIVTKKFSIDSSINKKLQNIDLRFLCKETIDNVTYEINSNIDPNFQYPKMLNSILRMISMSDQMASVDWYMSRIPIPNKVEERYLKDYLEMKTTLETFVLKYSKDSYEIGLKLYVIECAILQRLRTAFAINNFVESKRLINIVRNITLCDWCD